MAPQYGLESEGQKAGPAGGLARQCRSEDFTRFATVLFDPTDVSVLYRVSKHDGLGWRETLIRRLAVFRL